MLRLVNLAIAAIFLWCAIVQYNDPDPWLWIAVYAGASAMAGLAAFNRYYLPALVILAAACLVWMALLFAGVVDFLAQGDMGLLFTGMSPDRPYVELTREFGGLACIFLTCLIYLYLGRRRAPAETA